MRFLFCLVSIFFFLQLYPQQGIIQGYITDADNKFPLPGASVNVTAQKGDNTDVFGRFHISGIAPGQYELVVSHISYKTEIIPVEIKSGLAFPVFVSLRKTGLDLAEVRINTGKKGVTNTISEVDIMLRPVNTSQDILRIVPGLFTAQHAGSGKAEQIFLRGYDIDHGTDIAITVDGVPVNMVSHAHGQGYADLHFLIPETVEKVYFEKGPYFSQKGNLATAGFVDFQTRDFLSENTLKFEAARFNTQRISGQVKLINKETKEKMQQFYLASEYYRSDGITESPQHLHRYNVLGKYSLQFGGKNKLTASFSAFDSKWNASGQVPERAIRNGSITRYGSIDDSEGGNTGRINMNLLYSGKIKNNLAIRQQVFVTRYDFRLFSNFTFYLKDSIRGDGIAQKEKRNLFGYTSTASWSWRIGEKKTESETGAGFRMDDIRDIELARTEKRRFLESERLGNIREFNSFVYINQQMELTDRLEISGGLRFDHFRFAYKDKLGADKNFRQQQKTILSPKLNLNYTVSPRMKIFLNNGSGFHSNDTRVIIDGNARQTLPRVQGTDIGIMIKPARRLVLKTVLWHLFSGQEFIYVGDEGIVESGGRTRRWGFEFSARYQFNSWLYGDMDINFTRARSADAPKGSANIPLAPPMTSIGGLTFKLKNGLHGSLRYRYMAERAANETNTVKASGYFITDFLFGYDFKKTGLFVSVENILNRDWKEAQFNTESRLKDEKFPVTEIHFTPGTPLFIKTGISLKF